jgi:hypothetical protein
MRNSPATNSDALDAVYVIFRNLEFWDDVKDEPDIDSFDFPSQLILISESKRPSANMDLTHL